MKLTFWGAAQQVTGSMHLVELEGGTKILIDCGLDYENKKDFEQNNAKFPFDPSELDLLILTHSHIDHSGNIPNLIKQGFSGLMVCSPPTLELSDYLLQDSLNIQMMEIRKRRKQYYRKKNKKSSSNLPQPLYTKKHINEMIDLTTVLEIGELFHFNDELQLFFKPAGHILGAVSVCLEVKEKGIVKRIEFTGDLGNFNSKLVPDPEPFSNIDYLVSESTYGGRQHITDSRKAEEVLLEEVIETCVNKKGKLVIPAFSVGRTQAILFTLNQLFQEGKLPNINIYTDSPLAIRSTKIYQFNLSYLNDEAKQFQHKHGSLFSFPLLNTVENERESEYLSVSTEPCVIVSAAGMVEGGRIQMHVRNNVSHEANTILIAGFCAEGTLGDRLLKGQDFVEIERRQRAVKAKILRTDVFSAHPDHNQLLNYFQASNKGSLKQIYLVHGELDQMKKLAADVRNIEVLTPFKGQSFELD
jgi:metallo-beta-lactamase family protein